MDGDMDLQFILLALLCRARYNLDTFSCEFIAHMSLEMILHLATQPMRVLCWKLKMISKMKSEMKVKMRQLSTKKQETSLKALGMLNTSGVSIYKKA